MTDEQRKRIHSILYSTDSREELAERIVALEELVRDQLISPDEYCRKYGIEYKGWDSANEHLDMRMHELGIDVS